MYEVNEFSEKINKLHAIKLVNTPKKYRIIKNWLLGILLFTIGFMFLPWQQNVQGKGKVIPFSPEDRPQVVPSVIAGRIERWLVQEGQHVKQGDTICIISEVKEKFFDPQIIARTDQQIVNKEDAIKSKIQKVESLQNQITALRNSLKLKLTQAKNKVKQAQFKLEAEKAGLEAARINQQLAQDQYNRLETLFNKGLATLTELQNRNNKRQEAIAKLIETENKYNVAQNELINAEIELNSIEQDYLDKISKAESILNETAGDVYESQAEVAKLKIELSNLKFRTGLYIIRAPQSGFIVRALRSGIGETIKEGEEIVTIVPDNAKLATEMYIRAMDLPIVHPGSKVRIQFDGWPAIVFSGWPNVSVGTFGGVVQVVDKVNSQNGLFRILVTPDPNDEPWPEQIRAGTGIYGWAMLNRVRIWYELWRQFNGFPPDFVSELDVEKSSVKDKKQDKKEEEKE
ncbi:MAG: HlyD family secretion protein [Bacteroidia bacterium]